MAEIEIVLGAKYKDTLHGIVGVAAAHCKYLTGCDYVCLEFVKEGEVKEHWADSVRIEPLPAPKQTKSVSRPYGGSGGPHDPPKGHSRPCSASIPKR